MFKKSLLAFALTLSAFSARADLSAEAGSYQIDPMHSKVGFEIAHLVISSVEGSFKTFDGTIDINSNFSKSSVKVNIDVNSIDTGVEKRDAHLKSPDFFEVAKYPKMTFESKSVKGTPESFKMEGDLTIHGTKKRVTLEGKYLGAVTDGYGNRKVAFSAKTKISRKDFGLKWNNVVEAGPIVGDEVTIELKIQGGKPIAKK